jgi:hypothetical protein
MKKMLLALVLSFCFIAMSVNTASANVIEDELEAFPENVNIPEIDLENLSSNVAITGGPARFISDIEFISGSMLQINRIQKLMKIRLFKSNFRTVVVTDLSFEVTYSRQVTKLSRFTYATAYANLTTDFNNTAPAILYNSPHTVKFTNFTGAFHFLRPAFHRKFMLKFFIPAQFIFVGIADEVECVAAPIG